MEPAQRSGCDAMMRSKVKTAVSERACTWATEPPTSWKHDLQRVPKKSVLARPFLTDLSSYYKQTGGA